ncbi:hypothetical protein D1B31_11420 [Neobacillus notoginsengisoli]|uniref:YtzH-like protein n=1 Tax=Neobacillus notoginsengisoli TaxID=1578198 RepID=A0A417YUE9_9BACI|nr:YtzH-like family protein [Neobacillus notoginsengisoli]RHW40790.1 hypothetical protein D1B31_11420 [Neobacillus notoginsengisoli]
MPLSTRDQASILKDILTNHLDDCCGSVAECEQVERLVKSLMVNTGMNKNVKGILQEIYEYSQHGAQSANLDAHIESHQSQLNNWVNDIDQFSAELD